MKLADLPAEVDASGIFAFAMTFNGYEHFGSFEASAKAATSGDRSSLEMVLNELFFAARASRHRGDDQFVRLYHELLPTIRRHLEADFRTTLARRSP